MTTQDENMVECGYVGPDGVKCTEMIGKHHFSVKAHMRKVHGVDLAAKTEEQKPVAAETAPVPETKAKDTPTDPRIAALNIAATKIQLEQLDRVRKDAPDIQFGVAGDKAEMNKRTAQARQLGILREDEAGCWVEEKDIVQASRGDGRRLCIYEGDLWRHGQLVLTARPKVISQRLVNDHQKRLRDNYQKQIVDMKTAGVQAAGQIMPAAAVANPQ